MKHYHHFYTGKILFVILFLIMGVFHESAAQIAHFPIVQNYGGIYEIPEAEEMPDPSENYKIIIDLVSGEEDPKAINAMVDNIARMMNLHGLAGVPSENIQVKIAIHGKAIFSILNDRKYTELFGVPNPNLPVYHELRKAGAEVYVCGQSLLARDMQTTDIDENATLALSMLTTLSKYVPKGYMLLRF
ncbi:DsrE family protein [Pararhodonellum marinum]|uniref:DsrE family protein n=1 Tax=Pararhodonellum marinum TaxID=2755358 RepID=UPI001E408C68|nr:DsrE family protein [Pararhodonellum marinum]